MHTETKKLLKQAAARPAQALDTESLLRQARRRRAVRWLWMSTATSVFAVGAVFFLSSISHQDQLTRPIATPPPAPFQNPFKDLPKGWSDLPPPPEIRTSAASAWTGGELLVWGGYVYTGYSDESAAGNGFVFDPTLDEWADIPQAPLEARTAPAYGWTGEELLIWGGSRTPSIGDSFLANGAAYDPDSRSWRQLPPASLSARAPLSVWTGKELIVWGTAVRVDQPPTDGAAYNPGTNTWRAISDAPIGLTDATAVWTGEEMVVFGASLAQGNHAETDTAIGAAYDPEEDRWRRLPDSPLSPQASWAAWNGNELIAWDYLLQSSAYDPERDTWRKVSDVPLDPSECSPRGTAVRDFVFADFCGSTLLLDRAGDEWRDISRPEDDNVGFDLFPADSVLILMGQGRRPESREMRAYKP